MKHDDFSACYSKWLIRARENTAAYTVKQCTLFQAVETARNFFFDLDVFHVDIFHDDDIWEEAEPKPAFTIYINNEVNDARGRCRSYTTTEDGTIVL